MLIKSTALGEIEVEQELIYRFPSGLPGFEHLREFAIIQPDPQLPFHYLVSTGDPNVSLVAANPFAFYLDYAFTLPDPVKAELNIAREAQVQVLNVVSIRERLEDSTINLLAPIVLNIEDKLGKQVILHHSDYRSRHPLIAAAAEKGE